MYKEIPYRISRFIFEYVTRILFRVRVHGMENLPEPPFIIASNHSSLLDPPLLGAVCKRYAVDFMAKKELFDAPVVGVWTRAVRCIPVDRGRNSVRAIKEALRRVKAGHIVGVFPEGTRSADGDLQEAKRGTGFLISKGDVPVVPCYIKGSGEALPKGNRVRLGTQIDVYVGKPIQPREFHSGTDTGKEDYEAISGMIMDRIFDLKKTSEKPAGEA